jgi:hypothetical protein
MESFKKDMASQQSNAPFPDLENFSEEKGDDLKDVAPDPHDQAGQSNSGRPRRRTLKRTVESTKSAIRRRTISNPGIRRPIGRRLRFAAHDADNEHHEDAGKDKPERRDDFQAQLEDQLSARLSFKQRMRHFTWTWFTMTMATGGIANVL